MFASWPVPPPASRCVPPLPWYPRKRGYIRCLSRVMIRAYPVPPGNRLVRFMQGRYSEFSTMKTFRTRILSFALISLFALSAMPENLCACAGCSQHEPESVGHVHEVTTSTTQCCQTEPVQLPQPSCSTCSEDDSAGSCDCQHKITPRHKAIHSTLPVNIFHPQGEAKADETATGHMRLPNPPSDLERIECLQPHNSLLVRIALFCTYRM